MASLKRQLQMIENAYRSDSLNRSVLDAVDDKAVRRILKDALQPWYYVYGQAGSWFSAAVIGLVVFYLTSGGRFNLLWGNRLKWSLGTVGVVLLGYGFAAWLRSDYKSKLGVVWVMFREDEGRISRILKKMDVDEGRVQQVLVYGSKNALMRKVNAMMDQLKVSRERIKNIPNEIEKEQKALAAALLSKKS